MKADVYPSDQLKELAGELLEWLGLSELPVDRVTMNATPLAVWELGEARDLTGAVSTGEWHHQLLRDARAFAYARSRIRTGKPSISEVGESPLVVAIEDVMQTLKAESSRDVTLRLLRSTPNHTTALWLHGNWDDDELIVLQSPVVRDRRRLDALTFLKVLTNTNAAGVSRVSTPVADEVAFSVRTSDIDKWQPDRRGPVRQPAARAVEAH